MSDPDVPHVLVVDDEPVLRELLVDLLGTAGVEVSAACSGSEAIELAHRHRPDLLITDIRLGDCTGLEVIDRLRSEVGDIPAVVITAYDDPQMLTEVSRRRPVELMTKPLDLPRLQRTVMEELKRRVEFRRSRQRTKRLRRLAKESNIERKKLRRQLQTTCEELTAAYCTLSGQMSLQEVVLGYQRDMLSAGSDDDVFHTMFKLFVHRTGPVFGVAMVCDADAELRISGRFGVPYPDGVRFCEAMVRPLIGAMLADPKCMLIDAMDEVEMFDPSIRRRLVGVTILAVPLIPTAGQIIGLVVLYRKGEQPFTDGDIALAEMIAPSTAMTIRRND